MTKARDIPDGREEPTAGESIYPKNDPLADIRRIESVKNIDVIEVKSRIGAGTEEDPCREELQYWYRNTLIGKFDMSENFTDYLSLTQEPPRN